jgi:hypothetical protein
MPKPPLKPKKYQTNAKKCQKQPKMQKCKKCKNGKWAHAHLRLHPNPKIAQNCTKKQHSMQRKVGLSENQPKKAQKVA